MLGAPRSRGAWALSAVFLACVALFLGLRTVQSDATTTDRRARTVIVVRHAEKESAGDPKDPALSPDGVRRAETLARLLGPAHVTHLFATEFKRTQETLGPLAKAAGVSVSVVPAREAERLIAEIAALPPGAVCVVAGHSNTVPKIVVELSGLRDSPLGRAMSEDEFARMYVITLPQAGARTACDPSVIELRYGD
jgi:broad specificity phosphatase PhoE